MLRNLKEICTDVIINEIFLGIVTSDIEKCIINPIKQTLKKNLNAVTSIFQAVIRIRLTQLVLKLLLGITSRPYYSFIILNFCPSF